MIFYIKNDDYSIKKFNQIIEINNFDFHTAIEKELDIFKEEIGFLTWDIETALNRLNNGERLLGFFPEFDIKGWVWLNPIDKMVYNLYVNKKYRRRGWGTKLHYAIQSVAKDMGLDEIYCNIDDWNQSSISVATKSGWKILNNQYI